MKLLVTGGLGFIGGNFVHYWIKNHPEDDIVNLDAITYAGNLESLRDVESNTHYTFIKGKVQDHNVVKEAMEGVDTVVHFAAESHVDRSIEGPTIFEDTNVKGTLTLLEEAQRAGIKRFHLISTDEVFGELPLDQPDSCFTETTPYAPRSPYSASKAAADHFVRAFYHTFQMPVTISNCVNNYGPYMYPEKAISLFITNALDDKSLPIYGDGQNVREYIHVLDHCRGIDMALQKGEIGQTYLFGTGKEVKALDLATLILKKLNKPESLIEFVEDRKGHDHRYAIGNAESAKELGWQPEIEFEKGVRDMIKWYQDNRQWWERLRK